MSKLASKLKGYKVPKGPEIPVWDGPDSPTGGLTQSLLGRFLVCKERFRLLTVYGLRAEEGFESRIEYGNMWHVCEEEYARTLGKGDDWQRALKEYASKLIQKYRTQQDQVEKWYQVCLIQFPIYLAHWEQHPDVKNKTPLLQEETFCVPYLLPSGRVVWLRGKWDSVDVVKVGKALKIFLQENKTKSEINQAEIVRQLGFDIQTMFYLVALNKCFDYAEHGVPSELADITDHIWPSDSHWGNLAYGALSNRPVGVRYNVIRRPLSGGAGTIRQHKPTKSNPQGESKEEYYERLRGVILEAQDTYFDRFSVEVSQGDLKRFEERFLIPCLEFLSLWWEAMKECRYDPWSVKVPNCFHWQHPFGVYNVLNEGGFSDLDEHLLNGSTVGLANVTDLYPELS